MQADILGILTVAILLAGISQLLAKWIRQPPVILEILLGVSLGMLMQKVAAGEAPLLRPVADFSGSLHFLATLACSFIAFSAAVEARSFQRGSNLRIVLFSFGSIPFSLLASIAFMLAFAGLAETSTVFFLSICFMVTAVPVLLRLIHESPDLDKDASKAALSSACLTDIAAWGFVFVFSIYSLDRDFSHLSNPANIVLPVAALILSIVFFRISSVSDLGVTGGVLCSVLAVFSGGYIAASLGFPIYLGVFAYGLLFGANHHVKEASASVIAPFSGALLIVYFIDCGYGLKLGVVNYDIAAYALLAAALGLGAKFMQCMLLGSLLRLDHHRVVRLAVLLNSRGLMEVIFLEMGRELGFITEEIFSIFIAMAIVSTMLTSPLLKLIARISAGKTRAAYDLPKSRQA